MLKSKLRIISIIVSSSLVMTSVVTTNATTINSEEPSKVISGEENENNISSNIDKNVSEKFTDLSLNKSKTTDAAVSVDPNIDLSSENESISIKAARALADTDVATVSGIVSFNDKNGTVHIQDSTGGIAIYGDKSMLTNIKSGNLVEVKGKIATFKGLKEIKLSATDIVKIIEENKGLPVPEKVTIKDINSGNYDSKYVEINDATIDATKKTLTQGTDVLNIYNCPSLKNIKTGDKINVKGTLGRNTKAQIYGASCTFTKVGAIEINHTPITKASINSDLTIESEIIGKDVQAVELNYTTMGAAKVTTVNMNKGEGNKYSYVINKSELSEGILPYYIVARNINNIESKSDNYSVQILKGDVLGPEIYDLKPAENSSVGVEAVTDIQASIKSVSGSEIDASSIKVYFDESDVTGNTIMTESSIKYTPSDKLKDGLHKVKVEVSDKLGNKSIKEWSFSIRAGKLQHLFGQLHSHTSISDGTGTLDEAYDWASSHGADYYAVTDHSNWFDNDVSANINDGTASAKWKDAHEIADKWNNKDKGKFTAIYGYEMTWSGSTGGWGHMNTFNTPGFETRTNSKMDLQNYYKTIQNQPQSISQLNHPGKTFGDFADFGFYSKEADKLVNLVEVGNGEGAIGSAGYFPSYQYYTRALDKGWHVAPTNNQDNHKGQWLTANNARTVVLSEENSRDSIYEALRSKRVYATEDSNMNIDYTVNGAEMGSSLGQTDKLDCKVNIRDDDQIEKVSIIANGGAEVITKEFNSNDVNWEFKLDPSYSYYYTKVVGKDGDIAVTAPVWVGESINVGIAEATVDNDIVLPNQDVIIKVGAYNNEQTPLENVKVEYFKNEIKDSNRLGEFTIPKVETGKTENATYTWKAESSGEYTIYARVTMIVNGKQKMFTTSAKVNVKNKEDVYQVVIDGAHCNQYITGDYAGKYTTLRNLLKDKNAITVVNKEPITDKTLEGVKLLVITDPQSTNIEKSGLKASKFEPSEIEAIKKYVANGGNLILTTRADYKDGISEYSNGIQMNSVLEAIGTKLRVNDDEVIDNTKHGDKNFRLYLNKYDSPNYKLVEGITDGKDEFSFYSGASIILADGQNKDNVDFLVKGRDTTETLDSDNKGDNVPVAIGTVNTLGAEQLSSGGKVIVSGNTFFSDMEIDSANGEKYSNSKIIKNVLNWILPTKEVEKVNISQLKKDENNDGIPDLKGNKFTIEGYVTSQSEAVAPKNSFFEVVYVEDKTGGTCVFGISNTKLKVGQKVRVTGKVDDYQGEFELQVSDENVDLQILDENIEKIDPTKLSTKDSMLAVNGGKLVQVQGKLVKMDGSNLYIDDGSGVSRAYVEGYIWDGINENVKGKWNSEIKIGDTVSAIGLASEDPEGPRLRVRNTSEIKIAIDEATNNHSGKKHKNNNSNSTKNTTDTSVSKVDKTQEKVSNAEIVTKKVVNTLSTIVGEGVTAEAPKQLTNVDGNKLSLTTISKEGKYVGAVVTSEKDSAVATIPVSSTQGEVKAVYKFVPLLGKYIQLSEGVTIGTDAITLPTQANATYYAATVPMDSTETVTQGWAKVADSWYLVNATGDPKTGWQKDNTGWVYLSPSNGIMQTGWNKQGNTWYHLNESGYMSTGWVKTNDKWYYLNSDGSMASNTTIDGYALGLNGALVS